VPKYRKLYVKTTESLDINDMPDDFTRLMWVLLPLRLCRQGRGLDNPTWLRSMLFPLRNDVTLDMISAAMDWYEQRGMICRYQVEDRRYFYIPTFHDYQGNTTREADSIYPPPTEPDNTNSRPTHDQLTTSSTTDAICNTQYSDPKGPDGPPQVPRSFPEWESYLSTVKNKPALVRRMCVELYPEKEPPDYGLAGKVAKQMGRGIDGYRRLMSLIWEYGDRAPQGDLLPYLLRIHQGKERDNGTGVRKRKTSTAPVITGLGKKPDT
jgi:hypothetical protein